MTRRITSDAMESVSAKLHEFAEGLDEDERTVVDVLLAKATDDEEVSGYAFDRLQPINLGTRDFKVADFNARLGSTFCDDDHCGGFWELIVDGGGDEIGKMPRF